MIRLLVKNALDMMERQRAEDRRRIADLRHEVKILKRQVATREHACKKFKEEVGLDRYNEIRASSLMEGLSGVYDDEVPEL